MRTLLATSLLVLAMLACSAPANVTVANTPVSTPAPSPTSETFAVVGDWYCRTLPTEFSPDCGVFLNGTAVVVIAVRPDGWLVLADGYLCGRAIPPLKVSECK